jgi:hypothetical protein
VTVSAVMAWLRSKNRGQYVASHQPPARSVAVATTLPSISGHMKPSPILIGMRNPLPHGSQRSAGNGTNPTPMTDRQGIRGANYGSHCPPAPPDSPRPRGANLQGAALRPTPSDLPRQPIRAGGSRGRRFKSGRPDQLARSVDQGTPPRSAGLLSSRPQNAWQPRRPAAGDHLGTGGR